MPRSMTVEEFAPLCMQGGVDLIDVRSMAEFYEVHAVGALSVPLDRLNVQAIMESRGTRVSEPLYIICRSGGRSAQACQIFENAGFSNIINIEGGTLAWEKAGLPVNRGQRIRMSLDRQSRIVAGFLTLVGALLISVNIWFLLLPAVTGALMILSGMNNRCGLSYLLSKAPWNSELSGGCASANGCCSGRPCS